MLAFSNAFSRRRRLPENDEVQHLYRKNRFPGLDYLSEVLRDLRSTRRMPSEDSRLHKIFWERNRFSASNVF